MQTISKNASGNAALILLGLAQGAALFALYLSHKSLVWPLEAAPIFNAVLLNVLLLPLIVYWAHNVLGRATLAKLLLAVGLLVAGLGAYQTATLYPFAGATKPPLVGFPVFVGLTLVGFMVVPLISAWNKQRRPGLALGRWDYAALFEHAWRNAVITVQAGVLTGLVWTLLQLGAQLFRLIGVDWPHQVVQEAGFAIPVTTVAIALGMRAGLKRAAFIITLRNHWLTLTAWLLLLVGLIGSAFVLTSLAGVDKLFERGLSAFFLLWFAAFWVKFFNSAFQDGQTPPPFGPGLQKILPYTAVALLAITGLAAWALLLRVSQHGLTPDRVWGLLVAAVALCYGVGYSLSLIKNTHWMSSVAHANVVAALLMCVGIVLLLSPVLDARRLSTNSQMARLNAGKVKEFDVYALLDQGRFGYDALQGLSQQKNLKSEATPLALHAKRALQSPHRYLHYGRMDGSNESSGLAVTDVRARVDIYPKGTSLSEDFIGFLTTEISTWDSGTRQSSCFDNRDINGRCSLLRVDLNRDGQPEWVLWKTAYDFQPGVYVISNGVWKRVGHLTSANQAAIPVDIDQQLIVEGITSKPSAWNELGVGPLRYHVVEDTGAH